MEQELKSIAAGGEVPPDLLITFDDMHGLWGGISISLRGDGGGERRERRWGETQARAGEARLSRGQLRELVRLLVELRAWEQQTPERQALPDESRAALSISVGGQTSRVWEWFNELAQNRRLARIKDRMTSLTSSPR